MAELKHPHSEVPANLSDRRREIVRREVKLHSQKFSDKALLEKSAARDACLSRLYEKYGYTHKQAEDALDYVLRSIGAKRSKNNKRKAIPNNKLFRSKNANGT